MGLTGSSTGKGAADSGLSLVRRTGDERIVALAGNPNVGKSTLFNELTGMRQHTGNWPGKTVACAQGRTDYGGQEYILVDLPGCYSLAAHSAEEEAARDFICFGGAEAVVVVCDATCLERSLNLALQVIGITDRAVVCVNLMDEAGKKHIHIDIEELERRLNVPVVGISARSGRGLERVMEAVEKRLKGESANAQSPVACSQNVEDAVQKLTEETERFAERKISPRFLALRLLEGDEAFLAAMKTETGCDLLADEGVRSRFSEAVSALRAAGLGEAAVRDEIAAASVRTAERLCRGVVVYGDAAFDARDRRVDRVLTSRWAGFPVMFLMLALILYLTISGANIPSEWLRSVLFEGEKWLYRLADAVRAPEWVKGLVISGSYRVLAWVVSVMLPPMAIFFPLFTLMEDAGYLPRIAFNMDRCFQKCRACGKQCLTMMMGFGCNAAGVVGCRIIDSPRERLIAMLTNSFVPCNGRFPMLISLISIFVLGGRVGWGGTVLSAAALAGVIVLGVGMTLLASLLLSKTVLRGMPSSFMLELPPYRKPQIGQVIVRSIFDRTLFVLGRAAAVAAPAGALIWLLANVQAGDMTLLARCAGLLDPAGKFLGMDGAMLLAFILGWPANEIVLPVAIMIYTAGGQLSDVESVASLRALLEANGWTMMTAVCTMLFSLMHWPCSTTVLTVYRETKSLKWTLLSVLLPTAAGAGLCALIAGCARLIR